MIATYPREELYAYKAYGLNYVELLDLQVLSKLPTEKQDMNNLESFSYDKEGAAIEQSANQNIDQNTSQEVFGLVDRLDLTDVIVLKKFYATGKDFPFDTQPYCFPILYKEMKENNNLKICIEALRKRLDILVKVGLLEKINSSNPTNYVPINGKEIFVRLLITKFFVLTGLTKFL